VLFFSGNGNDVRNSHSLYTRMVIYCIEAGKPPTTKQSVINANLILQYFGWNMYLFPNVTAVSTGNKPVSDNFMI